MTDTQIDPAAGEAPPVPDASPYDALLLVSFGGPEQPDDVVPFLENVTRGRGIPRERLEEVGEHYFLFGGRSPINDQNRAFLDLLRADLADAGLDLPVYWGNRNWDPYLTDTLRQMTADGVTRAACFVTAAYSSYSGCRQYRENLAAARDGVPAEVGTPPKLDRFRVYFDHPGFLGPNVDAVLAGLRELPDEAREGARLVFVTHSIPTSMNDASGPPDAGGGAYVAQHLSVVDAVVAEVAEQTGRTHGADLVYCSRSGPPEMPWLEPDVNDHLAALHADGVPGVVIAPIGFVSDHMEVVYDLDTEALETARELGLPAVRAATAGTDARFVATVRDLLLERAAVERGEEVARATTGPLGPAWDRCGVDCCANARRVRPTAGGIEEA